ncbi:MAG: hypothetical protein R6V06_02120 [Kiritimatiellia bacterium]
MKRITFASSLLLIATSLITDNAGARPPNYDESKVGSYTLPDPLTFASGEKLTSPEQWPQRRKEILGLPGLPLEKQPALNKPTISSHLAYHCRPGAHGIDTFDWEQYISFTDRAFGIK